MGFMEDTWQGPLIKTAVFFMCVSFIFVGVCGALTARDPVGPNASDMNLGMPAVTMVRIAAAGVLLLIAGGLKEQDVLRENGKLPSLPRRSLMALPFIIVLLLSVLHVVFLILVFVALFIAARWCVAKNADKFQIPTVTTSRKARTATTSTVNEAEEEEEDAEEEQAKEEEDRKGNRWRKPKPPPPREARLTVAQLETPMMLLRCVALFDGLLCLGVAGILLNVGPTTDFQAARALIGLYTFIGGVTLPGATIFASILYAPRLTWVATSVYALQALHAAAMLLQALGDGLFEAFDGIKNDYGSDMQSCFPSIPSPLTLVLGLLATVPAGTKFDNAGIVGPCADPIIGGGPWYGPGCSRLGWEVFVLPLCAGTWAVLIMAFRFLWTVEVKVVPLKSGERAQLAWSSSQSSLSAKSSQSLGSGRSSASSARRAAFNANARIFTMLVLVLGVIAVIVLSYFVFIRCPGDGDYLTRPYYPPGEAIETVGRPPLIMNGSDTSTLTTSMSTTTTTSTTSSTTTSTTSTTTTTSTSSRAFQFQDPNFVMGGNVTNGTSMGSGPTCSDELPALMLPWDGPPPPRRGCNCADDGVRGFWAWLAMPVEAMAKTWCDLGDWAAVILGFFLYCSHTYAWSLAYLHAQSQSTKARQLANKKAIDRMRRRARKTGTVKAEEQNKIVLWKQAPRDPMPPVQFEVGSGDRCFNV